MSQHVSTNILPPILEVTLLPYLLETKTIQPPGPLARLLSQDTGGATENIRSQVPRFWSGGVDPTRTGGVAA